MDNALMDIFGALSADPLKSFLKDLNISLDFKDYNIYNDDIEKIRQSLSANPRAANSLVNNVL